ncbi:flagellin [Salinarchaeum sp. IM2453]|uniref:flagellin n=1 Tax=Salinarchaeum sp. IM2453 TaxID=2862870 RepID=UPI001C82E495|nr:flagellin [Salinarchaeum sp. IM2453]QZA87458.1 flagellin [Salinarchaeum sp. IM2453]
MGFSVSGATAIIFLGLFIAFGSAFTVAANSYGMISDAEEERADRLLEQQSTEVEIEKVELDEDTVEVKNDGDIGLKLDETTVVVDEEVVDPTSTSVNGNEETNLWLPGETAVFTVDQDGDRVTIVTETGILDRTEVD